MSRESPTYKSWRAMHTRCKKPPRDIYKSITVCDRWKIYGNFLEDMGSRPNGKTLDRIDNNKGYFKENCRWATYTEQLNNRSNTVYITFDGTRFCLSDWLKLLGINNKGLVSRRISNGWSSSRAVTTPSNKNKIRLDRR